MIIKILKKHIDPDLVDSVIHILLFFIILALFIYFDPFKFIKMSEEKTPFYTNSSQLPVGYTDDLFEAVELQEPLQTRYTGGTVHHLFLGERLPSGKEAKMLIKKMFNKSKMPYMSISPTFSICPTHGYLNGEQFECPECGAKTEVWARIVGYMRPISEWNDGKKSEYKRRKVFKT